MSRLIRNTAILAKIETTAGVDAAPTPDLNALLISAPTFETAYSNVDRDLLRGYMGSSEELVGTRFVKATFEVELSGSGTPGTAPAWGALLLASAFAEVINLTYVEYTPVSKGLKTLTIKYEDDGLIHTLLACMGTVELAMGEGERPLLKFAFTGLDSGAAVAVSAPKTFTQWKTPLVITNDNTDNLLLGATYADGVITAGTSYPSRGLSINVGNDVKSIAMLGGQSVDITNRGVTGSIQLELTAEQEAALILEVNANVLTTLALQHGTQDGAKVLIFAPAVQRTNPKKADYEGRRHIGLDLRLTPVVGNDELRIISL